MSEGEGERERGRQVLSIQSHVVHGHVGNTAACFPLQLLGYEVDVLNSVQLCNHTGYSNCFGQVLEAKDLKVLISGLRVNNILKSYTHILTGYIGSSSFLNEVYEFIVEMKKLNPNVIYVCDPVMGDNGSLYVPKDLLPVYKEKFTKVADIMTPNYYEAELLTGISIKTETDAQKAVDILLSQGVKTVIITSISSGENSLVLIGGNNQGQKVRLEFPKINGQFTGAGDLFTALLLGWSDQGLEVACQKAVMTMQAVLTRTLKHALKLSGGSTPTSDQIELQLVQSKRDIETPPSYYTNSH